MKCIEIGQPIEDFLCSAQRDGIDRFCVGVAPVKMDKVALVRRIPEDFMGGYWELAGGGVEVGETIVETLVRETQEELGVEIVEFLCPLDSFDYQGSDGKTVRQFNVAIDIGEQEIKLNPAEHDQLRWVSCDELSTVPFHLTSEIRTVLNSLWATND
jgi:8-oxo-dGTP diphosphatase